MAQFQSVVITMKGRALIAKMLAGAMGIDFKRIQTSSVQYTPGQLPDLRELTIVNQATLVSQITRINDTAIKIEGGLNNAELTQSYNCNTVGITAIDPDEGEILFGVTIVDLSLPENTPDFIPAFNGITSTGLLFDLILTVDNADSITLQVDPAATVTIKQLNQIIEALRIELASLYGNASSKSIPLSITEPEDWKDEEWWFEEINGSITAEMMIEVKTIPYDITKQFHIELDGVTETIVKATDDETAATEDELIIT